MHHACNQNRNENCIDLYAVLLINPSNAFKDFYFYTFDFVTLRTAFIELLGKYTYL